MDNSSSTPSTSSDPAPEAIEEVSEIPEISQNVQASKDIKEINGNAKEDEELPKQNQSSDSVSGTASSASEIQKKRPMSTLAEEAPLDASSMEEQMNEMDVKRPRHDTASGSNSKASLSRRDATKANKQRKPQGRSGGWDKKRGDDGTRREGEENDGTPRLPKRKVALLLGFNGQGYNGMQFQLNPDNTATRTIEGELFGAMVKAGAISQENSVDPKKVDLQRAARTDAGVSAAGNVVSIKMILTPPGCSSIEDTVQKINEHLPPQIRVWGCTRTLGGFNARTSCETRMYEYLFPSYVLLPPRPGSVLARLSKRPAQQKPEDATDAVQTGGETDVHPFWRDYDEDAGAAAGTQQVLEAEMSGIKPEAVAEESSAEARRRETDEQRAARRRDLAKKRAWRVSKEELDRFRTIMETYLGTHNFHNFTLFKPFNDKTVKRYIISVDIADPELYGDIEWISVKIHGQSFMLHQIRKMISMALLVARTGVPASVIERAFGPTRISIPKAPALGLLLERPVFEGYNNRVEALTRQGNSVEGGPVTFDPYAEEIHQFKLKQIYEALKEEEERAGTYQAWIMALDGSRTTDFRYLNPDGIIPDYPITGKLLEKEARAGATAEGDANGGAEDEEDANRHDAVESDEEGDARKGGDDAE